MRTSEKWIGQEENVSGSYYPLNKLIPNLKRRSGGYINAKKLYTFKSRYGSGYYITDEDVIDIIDKFILEENIDELHDYLYILIIEKFGINAFLSDVEIKIASERDEGYRKGKMAIQEDMKKLLGISNYY